MSPPQLARDTPVLNILKPVLVRSNILRRVKLQLTVQHWRQSYVSHVLHRQEPLLTQSWFHSRVLVTLRVTHLVVIVLHVVHQSLFLEVYGYLLAHLHAVHANVYASRL